MTTEEAATTAVVQINPQGEEAYLALTQEAAKLKTNAADLVIKDPATVAVASADLALLSALGKSIEAMRKRYVDPLNAHVKEINYTFRPLSDLVDEATRLIKRKINDYNAEQQRIKAEAERIERLRTEAEEAAAKLADETGQAPAPTPEPATPLPESQEVRSIKTDAGSIHTRKIPKWELIDFDQVPAKYKLLNEVMIGKLVRAGERDIPGIRIFLEDEISVSSKHPAVQAPAQVEAKPEGDIPF